MVAGEKIIECKKLGWVLRKPKTGNQETGMVWKAICHFEFPVSCFRFRIRGRLET